jgi:hypothetical protein
VRGRGGRGCGCGRGRSCPRSSCRRRLRVGKGFRYRSGLRRGARQGTGQGVGVCLRRCRGGGGGSGERGGCDCRGKPCWRPRFAGRDTGEPATELRGSRRLFACRSGRSSRRKARHPVRHCRNCGRSQRCRSCRSCGRFGRGRCGGRRGGSQDCSRNLARWRPGFAARHPGQATAQLRHRRGSGVYGRHRSINGRRCRGRRGRRGRHWLGGSGSGRGGCRCGRLEAAGGGRCLLLGRGDTRGCSGH